MEVSIAIVGAVIVRKRARRSVSNAHTIIIDQLSDRAQTSICTHTSTRTCTVRTCERIEQSMCVKEKRDNSHFSRAPKQNSQTSLQCMQKEEVPQVFSQYPQSPSLSVSLSEKGTYLHTCTHKPPDDAPSSTLRHPSRAYTQTMRHKSSDSLQYLLLSHHNERLKAR